MRKLINNINSSVDWSIIVIVLALFSLVALVWFFLKPSVSILTVYTSIISTLVATYIGAKLAFNYQISKDNADEKRRNISSGNIALFTISVMMSDLYSYINQIINPHRNSPMRFLEIQPTLNQFDSGRIDLESLNFLFSSDERNLVGELAAAQSHFSGIGVAIEERSRCHRLEVQPALEQAGIVEGGEYAIEAFKRMLGERLFATINRSTDDLIENLDDNLDAFVRLSARLTAILKQLYPNETILKIKDPRHNETESP